MTEAFRVALNLARPQQRVITSLTPKLKSIIIDAVRAADIVDSQTDKLLTGHQPPTSKPVTVELSQLVDENFPFDESQLAAINGIVSESAACLTGAAGTGKTTCTKAIVDRLKAQLGQVDMTSYWKTKQVPLDEDDDYEAPEKLIPSIALVSFTGRATQMIKKNFPSDWHGNIMTIHRCLGFMPEFFEEPDPESGLLRKTMRFVPTYNESCKLPWDIIVVDEAGMLGLDLWHQLFAAMNSNCRIIMIGDINQLPPTHGKSIFGFAMSNWPSWELTRIHRQVGANNAIVDNAWRILRGQTPIADDTKTNPDWKFAMLPVPEGSANASALIRKWLSTIRGPLYDPNRDSVITATNGYESTAAGYSLGQEPMNRQLALVFNSDSPRYVIDAGRDRKYFAVGDRVMATKNDYDAGITNGMTGIVTAITANGGYAGDAMRYGLQADVDEYLSESHKYEDAPIEFSLDDLASDYESQDEQKTREKKDRGPASHIVTVEFGESNHRFSIPFGTLAEVASLQIAYVVTCHKMQGGEAPFVAVICHQSHKKMLTREWLYTAVTRASQRCVLLYTKQGLATALAKQTIKGTTLAQKVASFQALQKIGIAGASVKVKMPIAKKWIES